MRLYTWLNRLFPRSFTAKMFLLAFLGIHLPLIALDRQGAGSGRGRCRRIWMCCCCCSPPPCWAPWPMRCWRCGR